jgi:hypothetical protein
MRRKAAAEASDLGRLTVRKTVGRKTLFLPITTFLILGCVRSKAARLERHSARKVTGIKPKNMPKLISRTGHEFSPIHYV